MPREKGDEWKHVTIVEESTKGIKVKCVYCSKVFVGGALRIRNHLAGDSKSVSVSSSDADDDTENQ